MRFLSLAWRNIRRNLRRTLLTLAAFALGVAALVVVWSIFDGSNAQMVGNMTGNYTGYIQIHRQGYADDPSVDANFSPQELAALRLGDLPGVAAVASRMETTALINSNSNSRALLVIGVDPQAEPTVTVLNRKLASGRYFANGDRGGILLGKSLAKVLGVGIGGEVAVLTQGTQGSIGAMRYTVQGLFDTGNDLVDGAQAYLNRDDMADLLSSGSAATSAVIKLSDRALTDAVVEQIRARVANLPGQALEVRGWQTMLPEVAQSVAFHEGLGKVVTFILFSIVVVGVANTIMMSVMERLREFGSMMAMGTSPWQIFRLIAYEGLLLGLLGFVVGLAVGYVLVAYLGAVGIDASEQRDALQNMRGVSNVIYPYLGWSRMLFIAGAVLLVTVLATLYPAWRAARLVPLHAIQGKAAGDEMQRVGNSRVPAWLAHRFPLLALALRNLARHRLRAALTLLAIAVGLGAFIFLGSVADGYQTQMVINATSIVTGDAQIQHKDFKADMRPGLFLSGGPTLLARLRETSSIGAASGRVQTTAMLSSATKSMPVLLAGISPTEETGVTVLYRAIKQGHYLQVGQDREIVIGRKLADSLHIRLGERVIVMAQALDGNLASEGFVVAGLFETGGGPFDSSVVHITLPASQTLLGLGHDITNIALKVPDIERLPVAMSDVGALLPPGDVQALSWEQLVPELVQARVLVRHALTLVLSIVLAMVSVIVMNTVLMSVLERTREFGTMLALGTRPGLVVRIVLLESAVIGVLGTLTGLGLGALLTLLHLKKGLSIAAHGGASAVPGLTDVIFPKFSVEVLAVPGTLLPLLVLLAAFYPALHSSRLEPIEALRRG